VADFPEIRNPERNEWLGIPADLLKKVQEVARAAAPLSPSTMLVDLLIGDAPKALDKLSYGERISTGKGETFRPNAESLDLAGLVPQGKMAAAAKGIAAALGGKGLMAAGIIAGEGARSAPLLQLGKAKELDAVGATRDQIFSHTGWWRGKDGKWRWEISDEAAKVTLPQPRADGYNAVRLKDVLDHPELYKNYPELKDRVVHYWATEPAAGETRGGYSQDLEQYLLKTLSPEQAKKTLLHENQHAVQYQEGFPTGGNPAEIMKKFPGMTMQEAVESYQRLLGEVEARAVASRADLDAAMRRFKQPWLGDVPEEGQTILPQRLKQL
jgi:hypothetical protein